MAVNVQNGSAVFFGVDDVFVPDFVVEGAAHVFPLDRVFYSISILKMTSPADVAIRRAKGFRFSLD
jgi:hypothetical protein